MPRVSLAPNDHFYESRLGSRAFIKSRNSLYNGESLFQTGFASSSRLRLSRFSRSSDHRCDRNSFNRTFDNQFVRNHSRRYWVLIWIIISILFGLSFVGQIIKLCITLCCILYAANIMHDNLSVTEVTCER